VTGWLHAAPVTVLRGAPYARAASSEVWRLSREPTSESSTPEPGRDLAIFHYLEALSPAPPALLARQISPAAFEARHTAQAAAA